MKIKLKVMVSIFGLAIAQVAFPAEQWGASNVLAVYPMADGSFVIQLKTDPPGCPAPSSPKYLWVTPGQNNVTVDGAKALLATALTAFASGKQLQVAFSDASAMCYVNRIAVVD